MPKKTVKVRVKMRPDEEIEVDQAELTDLDRQGLLVLNQTQRKALGLPAAKKSTEEKA
ncbi:MAG TPA: hypothetical protein VJU17_05880 [Gemmatimonadales bacterium]|nr:hypothetical protein [Gemmatimonadales bacterium]